jgi:translation initiation factor IF-3
MGIEREALGVMRTEEALAMAQEKEVDLVLVAPDAVPPVCRMIDYSKFKYELDKSKKEAEKKQRENM